MAGPFFSEYQTLPTVNLVINHSNYIRPLTNDMRREWCEDLIDVLRKIAAGESVQGASLYVMDGAGQGSGTFTFSGTGTATDTVSVGGVNYTAVASGATGNQWNVGATAAASAINLAACLNASANFYGIAYASVSGAVVTVTAAAAGSHGVYIALAKTSTAITVGGGGTLSTGATANAAKQLLY